MVMNSRILIVEDKKILDKYFEDKGVKEIDIRRLETDNKGVEISKLREWLKESYLTQTRKSRVFFLIESADSLTIECQNVLLKPLEEVAEGVVFVLSVKNVDRLLPTVISRCVIEVLDKDKKEKVEEEVVSGELWVELMRAWKTGPAESLLLVDKWMEMGVEKVLIHLMKRLADGLRVLPSGKRIEILKLLMEVWRDFRVNVNQRLVLGRFLLEGWRLVDLDSGK